jgi:nucleotide-binding universal stress UspA family protein
MSEFPAKILLATDGSEDAALAARAAISLARDTGSELHVVHVGPAHVYPPHTAGPTPLWGPTRRSGAKPRGRWTERSRR